MTRKVTVIYTNTKKFCAWAGDVQPKHCNGTFPRTVASRLALKSVKRSLRKRPLDSVALYFGCCCFGCLPCRVAEAPSVSFREEFRVMFTPVEEVIGPLSSVNLP